MGETYKIDKEYIKASLNLLTRNTIEIKGRACRDFDQVRKYADKHPSPKRKAFVKKVECAS